MVFNSVLHKKDTLPPSNPPHTLMSVDDQREGGGRGALAGIEEGGWGKSRPPYWSGADNEQSWGKILLTTVDQ
jgi:hypothetical protein